MRPIIETRRLHAPAPKPQALAYDGSFLWMGSLATQMIYQIDPATWSVVWQTNAPGLPFGLTAVGAELRALCGEGPEDNRIIRRLIPGRGFDPDFALPCPDDTGSQLAYDGARLHVSQWYSQRVLALGEAGQIERSITAPRGICGQVIVGHHLYLITTADEDSIDYFITRFDLRIAHPCGEDLAHVPFPARALAHDGLHFWTNHRAAGQSVRFELPPTA